MADGGVGAAVGQVVETDRESARLVVRQEIGFVAVEGAQERARISWRERTSRSTWTMAVSAR